MKIAIIGLGLIGGSMAKAIKAKTEHLVYGLDTSQTTIESALADGSIDGVVQENLSDYQMILLSLYPAAAIQFLKEHKEQFSDSCIIVDFCGIKQEICQIADSILADSSACFIGGHPMAGREFSGYAHSLATLFENASMILTPSEDVSPLLLKKTEDFFLSLGFGRITLTTPLEHDRIIAYTSQLAHIVSNAYVQSSTAQQVIGFSAGSFADLTRVAKLNEDMWSELFLHNTPCLISELDQLLEHLQEFREYLVTMDEPALKDKLKRGREAKEDLLIRGEK